MTQLEAKKLIAVLTALWPDAKWSSETCNAYEQAIMDLDYGIANKAVKRVCEENKFRPTVAEIRGAAVSVELGPKRTAMDAWGDVINAVRYVGGYGTPKFEDPVVRYVVERMGWKNLCWGETPDGVDRARFCEFYESMQDHEYKRRQVSDKQLGQGPAQLRSLILSIGTGGKAS